MSMPLGPLLVNLTGYCPYKKGLSAEERSIEGGTNDARDRPLHTLEDHLSDPTNHPYVSCAGDLTAWRYGQRVELPSISDTAIFRIVDTGGSFHGPIWEPSSGEPEPHTTARNPRKKIRVPGHEPIDVCVNDCNNHPPGFGAQTANVPDDGAVSNVANAVSDAFQSIGIGDPDLTAIGAIFLGSLFLAAGHLLGA